MNWDRTSFRAYRSQRISFTIRLGLCLLSWIPATLAIAMISPTSSTHAIDNTTGLTYPTPILPNNNTAHNMGSDTSAKDQATQSRYTTATTTAKSTPTSNTFVDATTPTPNTVSDAASPSPFSSHQHAIERGEYLVKLGDCIACHTAPNGKAFAGGLAIKTPFGRLYTPNITPDRTTGIGGWTTPQFIKAMRQGISPSGHYYYPAFPYPYFNQLTTQDLKDIKAYLDAIPPIQQPNHPNGLIFPFSWRFLQLGWRILFFNNHGPYQPNAQHNALWNRGAYLVKTLGHCSMCHTPSHYLFSKKWVLAAPMKKYYLAGGFVDGYFAPNITRALMKDVSAETLANVFRKDQMIGGGQVQGPMADANHNSLKYLSDQDVLAIATYLKTVTSKTLPQPKTGKGLAAGKAIFNQYCSGCHLTGAGGAPKLGDASTWGPLIQSGGVNALTENAIHGIGGMPPKGACSTCSHDQIKDAVLYLVSEASGKASQSQRPQAKPIKPLTLADGKKVYNTYCSACHSGAFPNAPVLENKQAWGPRINQGIDVLLTHALKGYKNMPPKGSCRSCSDAAIKAAVVYMVQESKTNGDYRLWLKNS